MTYVISKAYYNRLLSGDKGLGVKGLGSRENVIKYLNATSGIKGKIERLIID